MSEQKSIHVVCRGGEPLLITFYEHASEAKNAIDRANLDEAVVVEYVPITRLHAEAAELRAQLARVEGERDAQSRRLPKFFEEVFKSPFPGDHDGLMFALHQRDSAKAEVERVNARIENLLNSLEAVRLNDRSHPYEYGEKRRLDEATPGVGQRWSTPFEISRDAIRAYAESVFGKPGVQSKKQLDALALAPTPPAQQQGLCYPFSTETCDRPGCKCREETRATPQQEKHTTHPEGGSRET